MTATATHQPLLSEIDKAQEHIEGLHQNLQTVDQELSDLAAQREKFRLLQDACTTLESLSSLGAGEAFWGTRADASAAAEHLREVRARVANFEQQIRATEEKRHSVLTGIAQGSEVLAILEGDLLDAEEEEFQKTLEWNVDREIGPVPDGPQLMWARGGEDDIRLRKSLGGSLLVAALAALLLPLIKIPALDVTQVEPVPERIVRFIELDQHKPAPPPAPIEQPKPKEKEPLVAQEKPAEKPKAEPKPEEAKPVESARQRAQAAGVLAFRESLATIAERRPDSRLGAQARIGNTGEKNSGPPERSLITSLAPGGSGGINTAAFSRNVGGDGGGGGSLQGVEIGRVADGIGGSPRGTSGPGTSGSGDGALAGRTDEEIQIVFDRYKAALYRLYNRELRNDPSLRGQMVLRLTIEPDGSVSMCKLQSSDMNAPALSEQVVERVKGFAFGAKDVAAVTIVYPIDFLPAA